MELNQTIDIIIKDLNEAREIIDDLKKYPGVPEWQVELAKSKCKSASEVIALFKNLQVRITSSKEEKTLAKEEINQEKFQKKPQRAVIPPAKEFKKIVETHIPEASPRVKEESIQTVERPVESAIVADQFSNMPESFNEKLGSLKHEDDVLEILKTKPLSSLNEAIGINDKFLFISEIFNGDQESYNQAIQKLEAVGSLSDALAVIMSYTGENTENEAVKQLLDLIKRKFLTNE
jgi:copper chaperone CopZ